MVCSGAEAFIWVGTIGAQTNSRVAALSVSHHLISLGPDRSYAVAGGLLTDGPDYVAMYRRGAYYIDRILKGANAADLPVEYPTIFELVVNRTTAAALGVTIPDEVAQQVTSWI